MRIRRPSEKTIKILKLIGIGVLLIGIGAVPPPWALSRALKELAMGDTAKNRRWIKRRVYEVRRQRYVRASNANAYSLSDIGKQIVQEAKLWDLNIRVPKKWDGRWHLVVFDIPQEFSKTRIPFVRHLQNLGLAFYQRSVWIHPHDLADEVREVASFYGVLPYLSFITATRIDGSASLQKHFKLNA